MEGVESIFIVTPPAPNLEELEGNAVDAAQAVGVKHIVKLSVWCAEQGEFLFAEPHGAIEKQIKASGIPFTFLRPTGFMQNMLANAPTIEAQGAFYAPAGPARVAEIDFRDVARVAVVTLLENGHAGKAYELSGPEAMSHSERAEVLSKVLGKKIEYVSPTDAEWKAMVLGFGVPEWQADGVIDLLHYYKAGKSQRVSPSVEDVTGAKPIDYRQFVQDYADAFR